MNTPEFMTEEEIRSEFLRILEESRAAALDRVTGEKSIVNWLETIQSETDWRMIRIYLELLEEFAEHLPERRRRLAIDMFYPGLFDPSCTVRSLMAESVGHLMASSGEEVSEVWSEFLRKLLFPDQILEEKQKNWTAYALRQVLAALLEKSSPAQQKKLLGIYEAYFKSSRWGEQTCINLISGILDLSPELFTELQKHEIFGFIRTLLGAADSECRAICLLLLKRWLDAGWKPQDDEKRYMERMAVSPELPYCENYLKRRIRFLLSGKDHEETELQPESTSVLIQQNLHLDNIWVPKVIHLEILKRRFLGLSRTSSENADNLFQYATHLLNVLCMNTDAVVFRVAGEDLVEILPRLVGHQKYEIFQEALKEIEMGMDSSNYIPSFLGRTFGYLTEEEQKDIILQLRAMICGRDPELACTILEVTCEIARHLKNEAQETVLAGLLCRGLYSYVPSVSQEAFFLMATKAFGNGALSSLHVELARKLLIWWSHEKEELTALWPVLAHQSICRALSGDAKKEEELRKVAFFSGTFDPCSEKDIAIAREIRGMGFSVYFYIHEFAWYKNPQPAHIRRHIIELSIAELDHVYLCPENITINLSNNSDIDELLALFPEKEVYIVAETGDIEKNDSYWKEESGSKLRELPHIIFEGSHEFGQMDSVAIRQMIGGECLFLQLPSRYRDFSSGKIQQRIAAGKKISEYVDPGVQSMILDWRLYLDKPMFKKDALQKPIDMELLRYEELCYQKKKGRLRMKALPQPDPRDTYVAVRDGREGNAICGLASFREMQASDLLRECKDLELVTAIRSRVSGELLLLTGIFGEDTGADDYRQLALLELLTYCQKKPYSYMLCLSPQGEEKSDAERLFGFGFLPFEGNDSCRILDMKNSLVLFMDTASMLREPYNRDPEILEVIRRSQKAFHKAVCELYPGMLILAFQTDVLNHQLIEKIREDNHCHDGMKEEELGEKIYVPFGKILKGVRIPNTITKEMNTEKFYRSDLSDFEIREFPEYPAMVSQIRNIRSFAKPIVFVDDLYHKGYRIQQIGLRLQKENLSVDRMICGVVSGRGQDLAVCEGIRVEAVHVVPNMRAWVLESDMYPFVGGDGIETDCKQPEHQNALPSINFVLPYHMPSFMKETSAKAIYHLSEVCMQNSLELFRALEKSYQHRSHRSLTLERLGEVVSEPRYPESISRRENEDRRISEYIAHDIEKLKRLKRLSLL